MSRNIEEREFKWGIVEKLNRRYWFIVLKPYHLGALQNRQQVKAEGQHFYIMGIVANPLNKTRKRFKQSYISYDTEKKTKDKTNINLCFEDQVKLLQGKTMVLKSFILVQGNLNEEFEETCDRVLKNIPFMRRVV